MPTLILALLNLSILAAHADPVADREITYVSAQSLLAQEEYDDAEDELRPYLHDHPEDAELWNLLGETLWRQGELKDASFAFEKAVKFSPETDRAIYLKNLVDLQDQIGDRERAERTRRIYERLVKKKTKTVKPERRVEWTGQLGIYLGYDNNVALASEETMLSLARSQVASPFAQPFVSAQWENLKNEKTYTLSSTAAFQYYKNANVSGYNTFSQSISGRLEPIKKFGTHDYLALEDTLDYSLMNTKGLQFYHYSNTLKPELNWKHNFWLKSTSSLGVRYQKYTTAQLTSERQDRTGAAARGEFIFHVTSHKHRLDAGLTIERLLANGGDYSTQAWSIPINYTYPLSYEFQPFINYSWTSTDYYESLNKREDVEKQLDLGFTYLLKGRWSSRVQYSYLSNASSDTTATYTRHQATLFLVYDLVTSAH